MVLVAAVAATVDTAAVVTFVVASIPAAVDATSIATSVTIVVIC